MAPGLDKGLSRSSQGCLKAVNIVIPAIVTESALDQQVVKHHVVHHNHRRLLAEPLSNPLVIRVVTEMGEENLICLRSAVKGNQLHQLCQGPVIRACPTWWGQDPKLDPFAQLGQELDGVVAHAGANRRER